MISAFTRLYLTLKNSIYERLSVLGYERELKWSDDNPLPCIELVKYKAIHIPKPLTQRGKNMLYTLPINN
jgi:hypothetical protein